MDGDEWRRGCLRVGRRAQAKVAYRASAAALVHAGKPAALALPPLWCMSVRLSAASASSATRAIKAAMQGICKPSAFINRVQECSGPWPRRGVSQTHRARAAAR